MRRIGILGITPLASTTLLIVVGGRGFAGATAGHGR